MVSFPNTDTTNTVGSTAPIAEPLPSQPGHDSKSLFVLSPALSWSLIYHQIYIYIYMSVLSNILRCSICFLKDVKQPCFLLSIEKYKMEAFVFSFENHVLITISITLLITGFLYVFLYFTVINNCAQIYFNFYSFRAYAILLPNYVN